MRFIGKNDMTKTLSRWEKDHTKNCRMVQLIFLCTGNKRHITGKFRENLLPSDGRLFQVIEHDRERIYTQWFVRLETIGCKDFRKLSHIINIQFKNLDTRGFLLFGTRMLIANFQEEGLTLTIGLAIQHHVGSERTGVFHNEFLFYFSRVIPILQIKPLWPAEGITYRRLIITKLAGTPLVTQNILIKLNQERTIRIIEAFIQKLLANAVNIRFGLTGHTMKMIKTMCLFLTKARSHLLSTFRTSISMVISMLYIDSQNVYQTTLFIAGERILNIHDPNNL